MKGASPASKSAKSAKATISKGKGKATESKGKGKFSFVLREVCPNGEVVIRHSDHDLLRGCEGRSVDDFLKDDGVVEGMVAALAEEKKGRGFIEDALFALEEESRVLKEGDGFHDTRFPAVLSDFMRVFGTKATVIADVDHHSALAMAEAAAAVEAAVEAAAAAGAAASAHNDTFVLRVTMSDIGSTPKASLQDAISWAIDYTVMAHHMNSMMPMHMPVHMPGPMHGYNMPIPGYNVPGYPGGFPANAFPGVASPRVRSEQEKSDKK